MDMVIKWAIIVILCVEASVWMAYGAIRAFNGILREVEILKLYGKE